jgi:hypothetical protein
MMSTHELIARIHEAAKTAKVDAEANMFSRLAERVANQASLFEAPLTKEELALVQRFVKKGKK